MEVRGLYLFEHSSKLGNARAHELFDKIVVPSVKTPRAFSDYVFTPPEDGAENQAWRHLVALRLEDACVFGCFVF